MAYFLVLPHWAFQKVRLAGGFTALGIGGLLVLDA
jgi:hypothetical protein